MKKHLLPLILALITLLPACAPKQPKIPAATLDTIKQELESSTDKIHYIDIYTYDNFPPSLHIVLNYMSYSEFGETVNEIVSVAKTSFESHKLTLFPKLEIILQFEERNDFLSWETADLITGKLGDTYNKKRMTIPAAMTLEELVAFYSEKNADIFNAPLEKTTINLDEVPEEQKSPGSKYNPLPLNTTAIFDEKGAIWNYRLGISVIEIMRGDEAWNFINSQNIEGAQPPENEKEYIIAKIKIEPQKLYPSEIGYRVYLSSFYFFSKYGIEYKNLNILENDKIISFYNADEFSFYIDNLIDKDDSPTIAFEYNYNGGIWFATQ